MGGCRLRSTHTAAPNSLSPFLYLPPPPRFLLGFARIPISVRNKQVQFSLVDRRPLNGMVQYCKEKARHHARHPARHHHAPRMRATPEAERNLIRYTRRKDGRVPHVPALLPLLLMVFACWAALFLGARKHTPHTFRCDLRAGAKKHQRRFKSPPNRLQSSLNNYPIMT